MLVCGYIYMYSSRAENEISKLSHKYFRFKFEYKVSPLKKTRYFFALFGNRVPQTRYYVGETFHIII